MGSTNIYDIVDNDKCTTNFKGQAGIPQNRANGMFPIQITSETPKQDTCAVVRHVTQYALICRYFNENGKHRVVPVTLQAGNEVWVNPGASFSRRTADKYATATAHKLHNYTAFYTANQHPKFGDHLLV